MLVDDIASKMEVPEDIAVVDYAIGPKYSYVEVSGEEGTALGLSYLPSEDISRGFSRPPDLALMADFMRSTNIFERSIGMAMMNAISQYKMWNLGEIGTPTMGNIVDRIPKWCADGAGRRIVVVGNMAPLVRNLPDDCVVTVLERNPKMRFNALPDIYAPRVIPFADVLIISGAALLNDTIDHILSLAPSSATIMLVGPTAGLSPIYLHGVVHYIAGMHVSNALKVKEIVKLGGGRWDFSEYCDEYVLAVGNY